MNLAKKMLGCMSVIIISSALIFPSFAKGVAEWKKNDKGWWYEEADGSYPTSAWKYINNKWYYFDNIGYMVENRWIGNYYLGSDGAMLVSTRTPDGYYVDANGKWIESKKPAKTNYVSGSSRSGSSGTSSRSGGSGGSGSSGNSGSSGSSSGSGSSQGSTGTASNAEMQVVNELSAQGLSSKEARLYYLVNEYRESLGLPKLSLSKSLTQVARTHVADSNGYSPENQVDARGIQGNLHSWSGNGSWTPVVYTSDHYYASLMWSKPRELTSYSGNGYEISAGSGGYNLTPEYALSLWKNSSGHNAVMTTSGSWAMLKTMGVSIDGGYAHIWFGSDADPAGYYDVTGYQVLHP